MRFLITSNGFLCVFFIFLIVGPHCILFSCTDDDNDPAQTPTPTPQGSSWRFPRRTMMNDAHSPYPGPITSEIEWSYPLNKPDYSFPIIGPDGAVILSGNHLYVINPDGSLKWSQEDSKYLLPFVAEDGTIYVISYKRNPEKGMEKFVKAFHPNGSLLWEKGFYDTYGNSVDSIEGLGEGPDRNIIVTYYDYLGIHSVAFSIVYLNTEGSIECSFNGWGQPRFPMALTSNHQLILWYYKYPYYAYLCGCFDYKGGSCGMWSFPSLGYSNLATNNYLGYPTTDFYGNTFFRTKAYDKILSGVVAKDQEGNDIWSIQGICLRDESYPYLNDGDMALGSDGRLYLLGFDCTDASAPYLYAIHQDGWILWQQPVPVVSGTELLSQAGPVVDSDEHIYGITRSTVFAYHADGSLLWSHEDETENFKGLALSMDSTLYVVGDLRLYAFR
ncbi:hypothetical protein ACFL27_03505 [candidate division CSSED10-310 bacterium]|uniref:PQQ-like beta-propeller repeat protein n=1 Tax=candidate division CSSED10-310 bacterium TaxID=2855610 RepID=A0ABV6YSV2_UNCC1